MPQQKRIDVGQRLRVRVESGDLRSYVQPGEYIIDVVDTAIDMFYVAIPFARNHATFIIKQDLDGGLYTSAGQRVMNLGPPQYQGHRV